MRKRVFTWLARAEQGISCKDRIFQKGADDWARTTAGDAKAAAVTSEQFNKNLRRVGTTGKQQGYDANRASKVNCFHGYSQITGWTEA
jgi:hypothetical protein